MIVTVARWIVGLLLGVYTLRRHVYWLASLLPRRVLRPARHRSIAVLVAAHDEARCLPRLLGALALLDYPAERLQVVLVSDGSQDATAALMTAWAAANTNARAIVLADRSGKAAALQTGLAAAPPTDLVAVFDADTVPDPHSLAWFAGAFDDLQVGAVSGLADPGIDQRGMVARYAALERWVTHLVTLAGKDRLGWQPTLIGAGCCFRTEALAAIGGFPSGAIAEDVHLSQVLAAAGWRLRWLREAVLREDVPSSHAGFRAQRLRWSAALWDTAGTARRFEDLLVASGYLDRVIVLIAAVMTVLGLLSPLLLLAWAIAPAMMIAIALCRARPPHPLRYLAAIGPMIALDIAITFESWLGRRRRLAWRSDCD